MASDTKEIASRLNRDALSVCQHFLPEGRRSGNYWVVGDVRGAPGRSMFVRLKGSGGRKPGRWTDAASGEYGDLLDVIRESAGLSGFGETLDEARRFLVLPRTASDDHFDDTPARSGSPEASRRLFAASRSIFGAAAELYLRYRAITHLAGLDSLRFHPRCYYRPDRSMPGQQWPALIAAVSDPAAVIAGVHRTYLARRVEPDMPDFGKAPIETPRRAMGELLGNAVRFGRATDTLLAGEGIETVLSLRCVLPGMPMAAALSAGHLGAITFTDRLRRLYVAVDRDDEGAAALRRLTERGHAAGIDVIGLVPALGDFNDDLRLLGAAALRQNLALQLEPRDAARFLSPV